MPTQGPYTGARHGPPGEDPWLLVLALLTVAAMAVAIVLAGNANRQPARDTPRASRAARPKAAHVATRVPASRATVRRPTPSLATVTVPPVAAELSVPRSYFGFSTEYWAMPVFERDMPLFERVLSLARTPGDGPLLLRIGGDSTDHALYDVNLTRLPRGVFELTPAWFRQTSALVSDAGARVILDLNLVTDLPRMAALWARAAELQLPPGSIVGYEIGNEPDIYNPSYWSTVFSPIEPVLDIRLFPQELSPSTYIHVFQSYARALARFAPQVPLVAPVVAYPAAHLDWIRSFLEAPHPRLGLVSAHLYPYSACAAPGSSIYPTIARLLSENATAGMASSLKPAIELAHGAGLPFRLTELNSVTCGGVAGVSDTFATALWAPDALFELLRAGVDGVNIHVRAYAINAAFALTENGLVARPLLYGLIMFARTLGPDAQLTQLRLSASGRVELKAWAVRVAGGRLHVLLINKSGRSVTVALRLPTAGPATVQRLLAPSAAAQSGVTLDGQRLGPDGNWEGRPAGETIHRGADGYVLAMPALSEALVGGDQAARRAQTYVSSK